jgi:sporulation protein YlmC with PRC-barrel domain
MRVNCLDGTAGSVSRLVALPGRRTPAYIVVKLGRVRGGREITVPVSSIVEVTPDVVELGLTLKELKAFPRYEVKVRSGTYPPGDDRLFSAVAPPSTTGYMVLRQRSVPDEAIEVRRGTPVRDSKGRLVGTVDNVLVDRAHRQISHIIVRRARRGGDLRTVPVDLVGAVRDGSVYLTIPVRRADGLEVYPLEAT